MRMGSVEFKDKLRAARTSAGLKQTELAAISGVPLQTLRKYEMGLFAPKFKAVVKLATALGLKTGELMDLMSTDISGLDEETRILLKRAVLRKNFIENFDKLDSAYIESMVNLLKKYAPDYLDKKSRELIYNTVIDAERLELTYMLPVFNMFIEKWLEELDDEPDNKEMEDDKNDQ
jgi:transcriptional regulator with XRE-family HTH domain